MHTHFWGLILPVRSLTANITRAFRNESKDILCFFSWRSHSSEAEFVVAEAQRLGK